MATKAQREEQLIEARLRLAEALARCDSALQAHAKAVDGLNQSTETKIKVARQIISDRQDARDTGSIPVSRAISGVFSVPVPAVK